MSNDDLAHLNFQELLEERAAALARRREIVAELAVGGRPNDSRYRHWRTGMNFERSDLTSRIDRIRVELARRQAKAAKTKSPAGAVLSPNQLVELDQRRARLRQAIAEGGPDALLVGFRRMFTRLYGGVPSDRLPLTADEFDVLRAASLYLRGRYGSTPVKEATHGEGG